MTDANLMEADCIHGNVWYECEECGTELGELLENDLLTPDDVESGRYLNEP